MDGQYLGTLHWRTSEAHLASKPVPEVGVARRRYRRASSYLGEIVVELASERHVLIGRGALTFDSMLPLRFCNERDRPSVYVLAVTPPVP
jgi:hypothetical protein